MYESRGLRVRRTVRTAEDMLIYSMYAINANLLTWNERASSVTFYLICYIPSFKT